MNLVLLNLYLLITIVWCYKITKETYKGKIKGTKIRDSKNGDYATYFGIPYAFVDKRNPFGASKETPFMDFDANDSSVICHQMNHVTNEVIGTINCLRLNIYVPRLANSLDPVPVLLWFRGEEKDTEFNGKYLLKHGIIVVVANYRLGPYGFLCLDDPAVSGNQGLKDQHAALVWVSQNIPVFGGDRNKITIAGQGASVELHLYSKMLKMFDKVIIHSGTSLGEGMYIRGDDQAAIKIAYHLGHNTTLTREAVNILTNLSATEVVKASAELNLNLSPCIEKKFKHASNFVVQDALHLGNDVNNKFSTTKIMIGYTSNEKFDTFVNKTDEDYEKMQDIFNEKLASNYNLSPKDLRTLAVIVKSFYLGSKEVDKDAASEISNFVSDISINYGVEVAISRYVSQFGPPAIYKWVFSYTDSKNESKDASNSEELKYLFGKKGQNYTNEQNVIKDIMTEMWANFVNFGNPTPGDRDMDLLPVEWSSITDDFFNTPCMNIDTILKLDHNINHERIAFWDLFSMNYLNVSKLVVQD